MTVLKLGLPIIRRYIHASSSRHEVRDKPHTPIQLYTRPLFHKKVLVRVERCVIVTAPLQKRPTYDFIRG